MGTATTSKGENEMIADVTVKPTEDGKKYKVMVNCIKRGADYSSEATAQSEATKLRQRFERMTARR